MDLDSPCCSITRLNSSADAKSLAEQRVSLALSCFLPPECSGAGIPPLFSLTPQRRHCLGRSYAGRRDARAPGRCRVGGLRRTD